jgi:hypothetical protein
MWHWAPSAKREPAAFGFSNTIMEVDVVLPYFAPETGVLSDKLNRRPLANMEMPVTIEAISTHPQGRDEVVALEKPVRLGGA